MNKEILRKHKFRSGIYGHIEEENCIVCNRPYLVATKARGGRNYKVRGVRSRTCCRKCSRTFNRYYYRYTIIS